MTGLLLVAVILALALLGSRLFVIVAVSTALCFLFYVPSETPLLELDRIVTKMESLTTKNVFLSIPFFVASGSIMTRGASRSASPISPGPWWGGCPAASPSRRSSPASSSPRSPGPRR